jgi:hypothetical protein
MEFAEITLLVMFVAWFLPMGVVAAFLMWRYSVVDLDVWVHSSEMLQKTEALRNQAKQHDSFSYDLNNIDLSKVRPSMLKPKVSAKRYSATVE